MAEALATKRAEEPTAIAKSESLFARMNEICDSISRRAFELFESNGRIFGRELDDWFQAERELLHPVHINITESDQSLEVQAEVPGFSEKELEIGLEPRKLTITGKRETKKEEKKGKTLYSEQASDKILRIMSLPAEVQPDKASATLKNGVLTLMMPKAAKAQIVPIQPKTA